MQRFVAGEGACVTSVSGLTTRYNLDGFLLTAAEVAVLLVNSWVEALRPRLSAS